MLLAPVTDAMKNKIIEELRINEFWQDTGIIELIENIEFNLNDSNNEQDNEDKNSNESETNDL